MDYKTAGVDVEAGYQELELIKSYTEATRRPEFLNRIGGVTSAFDVSGLSRMKHPILLSGADGVGTKLKLSILMDRHDTVGIDCVAMCANDVMRDGAEPLFFLDYIACGKNDPYKIAQIVKGVAEGCKQADCALVGGETAEHPGMMAEEEYDLAGFCVGVAEKDAITTGEMITPGDAVIGLASTGVHSNGFSLVRKVFDIETRDVLEKKYDELGGQKLGDVLLTPTRIYVHAMKAVKEAGVVVKGCSHITGGAFFEKIPRMLPDGMVTRIHKGSWEIPPVFDLIQRTGQIEERVMYNTFNMGIGYCLVVDPDDVTTVLDAVKSTGDTGYVIGEVVSSKDAPDMVAGGNETAESIQMKPLEQRKGVELC